MTPRTFAKLVATAALVAGVFGVILQVHAPYTDNYGSVQTGDCGTAFAGHNMGDMDWQKACDSALSTRRLWAFPLLGIGALVLLGAYVVRSENTAK